MANIFFCVYSIKLYNRAKIITKNIAYYLPRHVNVYQVRPTDQPDTQFPYMYFNVIVSSR